MNHALFILAHDGTEKTIAEFEPYWEKVAVDYFLCAPRGSRMEAGMYAGVSAYKGREILRRFIDTLEAIEEVVQKSSWVEQVIIAEYDTLPLTGRPPQFTSGAVNSACVVLRDPVTTEPDYSQICMLSPWVVQPDMLLDFANMLKQWPGPFDGDWTFGLLDRMLGAACLHAGFPIADIPNAVGWAADGQLLRWAAEKGADWIHGAKSFEELKTR